MSRGKVAKPFPRRHVVAIRVSEGEAYLWEQVAKLEKQSVAAWVRFMCNGIADITLQELPEEQERQIREEALLHGPLEPSERDLIGRRVSDGSDRAGG